ncbi:MAG: A/G-specific adenine glycosylase [Rhodocyclaceae bacterium]|nr:A/G-specific adenine glycosylase [Rhodocyclaceae bacterium]
MKNFAARLIGWQKDHGRHGLPWQGTTDPYRVWLSEIMLQQTQVTTVIPYYERFLVRFPTLAHLAAAALEDVLSLWSGLGYYARARNLHACALQIRQNHGGEFPNTIEAIAQLPGIGRSTAHAIAVFCFHAKVPILDGNVRRLLSRIQGSDTAEKHLWKMAADLLPDREVDTYIQAQMDMGSLICTRTSPRCECCPVADMCVAYRDGLETSLPSPRPKKQRPVRAVTMLVLRNRDGVWLMQRPPSGLWGGLLSLPELPEGESAADHCIQTLGLRIETPRPAPTLIHDFTHFRWVIQPLICTAIPVWQAVAPPLRWVAESDLMQAALPSAIRKILNA